MYLLYYIYMFDFSFLHNIDFSTFIQTYGFIGVFIWYVTFDQLIPIPNEVTLLTIGFLAHGENFSVPLLAIIAAVSAFAVVDLAYYFLSRSGNSIVHKRAGKRGKFFTRYEEKLKSNLGHTLLILTFIPRMRILGPIIAGTSRVPLKKFVGYDSLCLMFFTTLYVLLGLFFHQTFDRLFQEVQAHSALLFIVLLTLVAVVLLAVERRQYRERLTDRIIKVFSK